MAQRKRCVLTMISNPDIIKIGAMCCSTNTVVIDLLIYLLSCPFPAIPLRRHHAQTVIDGASSNEIK